MNAYLEHEGQRRLYTAINILHILKDFVSRSTKEEVSSLLVTVARGVL